MWLKPPIMRLDQQNNPEMVWQGLKGRDYSGIKLINQMYLINSTLLLLTGVSRQAT